MRLKSRVQFPEQAPCRARDVITSLSHSQQSAVSRSTQQQPFGPCPPGRPQTAHLEHTPGGMSTSRMSRAPQAVPIRKRSMALSYNGPPPHHRRVTLREVKQTWCSVAQQLSATADMASGVLVAADVILVYDPPSRSCSWLQQFPAWERKSCLSQGKGGGNRFHTQTRSNTASALTTTALAHRGPPAPHAQITWEQSW